MARMASQSTFESISCALTGAMKPPLVSKREARMDTRRALVLASAALCATVPLESTHLLLMLAGAVGYLLFFASQTTVRRSKPCGIDKPSNLGRLASAQKARRCASPVNAHPETAKSISCSSKVSAGAAVQVPVVAPTFQAVGLEAEVDELVGRLLPTAQCDAVIARMAKAVCRAIQPIFPDAEVLAFTSTNLANGKAFGVAVPDVDVIVNVKPERTFGRSSPPQGQGRAAMDPQRVYKHVLRKCTEKLVSSHGFKFRRSAFKGSEPKVTVLAPSSLGLFSDAISLNVSVNAVTPLNCASLLAECGQLEPRARALALLVRRWAKDRGICHTARGHFSPYLWTLLVIYFLQVRIENEGALLPPLAGFQTTSRLVQSASAKCQASDAATNLPGQDGAPTSSVGQLFKEFVRFYATNFDWQGEAVSVRLGHRAAPDPRMPLHQIGDRRGPSIEDPFEQCRNLGTCANAASLERLHEELSRASSLCSAGESLTILLEPWSPPVDTSQDESDELSAGA